jgi:hypothetical protein
MRFVKRKCVRCSECPMLDGLLGWPYYRHTGNHGQIPRDCVVAVTRLLQALMLLMVISSLWEGPAQSLMCLSSLVAYFGAERRPVRRTRSCDLALANKNWDIWESHVSERCSQEKQIVIFYNQHNCLRKRHVSFKWYSHTRRMARGKFVAFSSACQIVNERERVMERVHPA